MGSDFSLYLGVARPDIATAQKVAFAASLLGATGGMNIVRDCRKNGSSFSSSVSD